MCVNRCNGEGLHSCAHRGLANAHTVAQRLQGQECIGMVQHPV